MNPRKNSSKKFNLTDTQAEAILNMRLRSLRKLEEVPEIKTEHTELTAEKRELNRLLKSKELCRKRIALEITEMKRQFGGKTSNAKRRTDIGDAPPSSTFP